MGKTPSKKRDAVTSAPYDKRSTNSKAAAAVAMKNNVFKFNTNVGQHILKNPGIADAIVDKANLKPTDTVLEIGPGTGNISVRILEKAKKLIAIELDPRMAAELTKRTLPMPPTTRSKLEIILGDAIKMPFPPGIDVCISNTPYQISSPLVFKLLSMQPSPPRCCVLMFQREFALRLTARPGEPLYNRLSVNAQFFAKVTHIMKVGRQNFRPPPQVESSVVKVEPYRAMGGGDAHGGRGKKGLVSWDEFDGLLRIVFGRKNKTIRASFGTKEVLGLVERNYRTYCALHDVPVEDGLLGGGDEEDMEEGGEDGEEEAVDAMEVDGSDDPPRAHDEWDGFANENGLHDAMDDQMQTTGDGDGDDDTPAFFTETATTKAAVSTPKTPSKRRKTFVGELVRQKVDRVLKTTELGDQRAGKLDENAFLKLLYAFHQENIHFA